MSRGLAAAMTRGNGEVTLRLNPESLGFVRVKLEIKGEAMTARFEASTNEARSLLQSSGETLRAALEARGWESPEVRFALLEERDPAAEMLRRLAREGEAVAQRAALMLDGGLGPSVDQHASDPRSGPGGQENTGHGAQATSADVPGSEASVDDGSMTELVSIGSSGGVDLLA